MAPITTTAIRKSRLADGPQPSGMPSPLPPFLSVLTALLLALPAALNASAYADHLGENPPGFDYADILPDQGRYHDPVFLTKSGRHTGRGHVSDVIADLALAWLDKRDPNRPFAICIHDKATHMPWQPAQRFDALFANETLPEPATLHDDLAGRAPVAASSWLRVEELLRWQQQDWGGPPLKEELSRLRRELRENP